MFFISAISINYLRQPLGTITPAAAEGKSLSTGLLCRQQVAVGAEPAKPGGASESPIGAQAHRPHFEDLKAGGTQQMHRLPAREQVQRQAGDALMDRHDAIAGR